MTKRIGCTVAVFLAFLQSLAAQVPAVNGDSFPLYLEVQLARSTKLSSAKSGDIVEGMLVRDVYSSDRKTFSKGSTVRMTVDHVDRVRKTMNDSWPWIVRAFTPRHERVPVFKTAVISRPEGGEVRLQVSLISTGARTEISTKFRRGQKKADIATSLAGDLSSPMQSDKPQGNSGTVMSLNASFEGNDSVPNPEYSTGSTAQPITVPTGTDCRVLLLNRVSASKSHPGDDIQARLLEPVFFGAKVALPVGTLFEGSVLKSQPPRMLSRAGSLSLRFTHVTLPDGSWFPVAASLNKVELSRGSHTRLDAEGRLEGERPGVKWMLINGGVTSAIAKEVDDGTQLVIEAIVSGATDASTAGVARIAGAAVSGIFMLTRHGRDVVLPDFTNMNITLTRPLTLLPALQSPPSTPRR